MTISSSLEDLARQYAVPVMKRRKASHPHKIHTGTVILISDNSSLAESVDLIHAGSDATKLKKTQFQ